MMHMARATLWGLAAAALLATLARGQSADALAAACEANGQSWWEAATGPDGVFDDDCTLDDPSSACYYVSEVHGDCVEDATMCTDIVSTSDTTCASGQYCCTSFAHKQNFGGTVSTRPSGACIQECLTVSAQPRPPSSPAAPPSPPAPTPIPTPSSMPPPPPPPPPLPTPDDESVAVPVAGGVAGAVVLLGVLAVFFFWLSKRRRAHAAGASPKNNGKAAAGNAVPAMIVGNMNDTLASDPPSALADSGAAGFRRPPSWASGAASSAPGYYGAPSSMKGQGSMLSMNSPLQPMTASSGGSAASYHAAQTPPGWLQPPPVHDGLTTLYLLPSTFSSGGAAAVASMLATQRPAGAPGRPDLLSAEARKEQLQRALYTMAMNRPPDLFMGRFLLMRERRVGGQATVQFARSGDGGFFQYAVKFFHHPQDYHIEEVMYRNADIKPVLPDLFAGSPNGDGAVRSPGGYAFPPFLVMERGMTLAEWLQAPRDALVVLGMFKDCAALLVTLHSAGYVHRDLKPDNVLLMLQTQNWRLIDFGIAAPAGNEAPAQCTLGYAAPEVVRCFDDKEPIASAPAQDVWALGVMIFEALTRRPAVDPFGGVTGCVALARGEKQYPWEVEEQAAAFGGSRARELVETCLARDPENRPTAAALVDAISMFTNRTETARAG